MLQRIGKYEVLETLAGGGQGTAYHVRNILQFFRIFQPHLRLHTGELQAYGLVLSQNVRWRSKPHTGQLPARILDKDVWGSLP